MNKNQRKHDGRGFNYNRYAKENLASAHWRLGAEPGSPAQDLLRELNPQARQGRMSRATPYCQWHFIYFIYIYIYIIDQFKKYIYLIKDENHSAMSNSISVFFDCLFHSTVQWNSIQFNSNILLIIMKIKCCNSHYQFFKEVIIDVNGYGDWWAERLSVAVSITAILTKNTLLLYESLRRGSSGLSVILLIS